MEDMTPVVHDTGAPEPPAPRDTAPEMSGIARLINVLISPTETFQSIRSGRTHWYVPLILFSLMAGVAGYLITQKIDMSPMTSAIEEKMRDNGVAQDEIDAQIEQMEAGMPGPVAGAVQGAIVSPIMMTIIALVLWGAMRAAGGNNGFLETLAVTGFAWIPNVIKGLLTILFALRVDSIPWSMSPGSELVKSNLGFLVDRSDGVFLDSLLGWVDVFGIWSLVLLAIGLSVITGFSKTKIGIFLGVVYVILAVGFSGVAAAVSGMMGF